MLIDSIKFSYMLRTKANSCKWTGIKIDFEKA